MKQQPSNVLLHSSCQTKNVINIKCCLSRHKQRVGSAVSWKPCLINYKWNIKNNVKICKIVRHYIEECKGVSNLRFIIVDFLNNVYHISSDEIDDLLLYKKAVLDRYTCHTTQGVKWNPWLEENKVFSKGKVTEQMNFFNPSFSNVHGNHLIDLLYKSTHWFLYLFLKA